MAAVIGADVGAVDPVGVLVAASGVCEEEHVGGPNVGDECQRGKEEQDRLEVALHVGLWID